MERRPFAVAAALVLAPLVVLAVVVVADGAPAPAGDVGLIELRVGDVGTDRTPLLGSYSRFGYNQPGPALLWALAVPHRLAGARYVGLEIGSLALAAASFAAVLWVARRRAGAIGVAGSSAVLALFVHGVGPGRLVDPWEPHVLVPIGLALLVLAADTVAGRVWSLPLVALAASFIGQSWGTMLVFATALGAWAAAWVALAAWRAPDGRRAALASLAVSAVVVLALWAPALAEQARTEPGNLVAMSRALRGPEPKLGAAGAWRTVAVELGHRPTWVGFRQRLDVFSPVADLGASPAVPVGAVALAAALAVALARRWWRPAILAGTATTGVAAAWWSLSRLIPPVFVWIPRWLGLLGAAAALAVGAVAVRALPPTKARDRALPLALGAVTLVAGALSIADATSDWRQPDPWRTAVAELAGPAAELVAGDDAPVLARSRLDVQQALGGQDVALEVLVGELERRGADVVVDREDANRFGPERAHPERAEREVRLVAAAEPVPEGFEVVATADPLGAAGRRTRERILVEAGLGPTPSLREVLVAIAADPSLRRLADELDSYPDLPVVALVVGPAT